jgi:O-antigen/teichoic acid export membrane protein
MSRTAKDGPLTSSRKRPWAGNLIQNAVALMLSSGGTAVFGLVFWAAAAHLAKAEDIGLASAEIVAVTLIANLSQLSYTTIFDRFLPVTGNQTRRFVTRAYTMCALVGFIVAVVYVYAGFGRRFIPSSLGWRALFVVAVVLWTIFVLQDSVLTGLRSTRWVPVENILCALAKLALLPAFLVFTARQGIFLAWAAPVVVAIGVVNWYLFRKRIPNHEATTSSSENLPSRREFVSLAFGQYAISLLSTLSTGLVVLIVIERLGPVAEAHYYVPAMISSGVGVLLWNLVTSFLVEASSDPKELRQHANITIRAAIIVLIPSISIGVAFAPEFLRIFGASYAATGTTLLRMLLLSLPGTAVSAFYYSLAWLDRRVWFLAGRSLVGNAIYFAVIFTLIGHFGILSVGIASLVWSGLQVIFFLPISIRRYQAIASTDRPPKTTKTDSVPNA